MDIGEIRIGNKRIHPDLAKKQIQVKLGKCLNTTKYILISGCAILFVKKIINNTNNFMFFSLSIFVVNNQILGIALFGVGISTLISQKAVQALHIPGISSLPIWMIVIGVFICVLSSLGGLGSFFYRRSFLIIVKKRKKEKTSKKKKHSYIFIT